MFYKNFFRLLFETGYPLKGAQFPFHKDHLGRYSHASGSRWPRQTASNLLVHQSMGRKCEVSQYY